MPTPAPDRCRLPPAFWRELEHGGIAPAAVLRLAQLPLVLPMQPARLLSTAQLFALWQAVAELSGDPVVGLSFARGIDSANVPPSDIAALHARDFRDGLRRTARFKQLCTPERMHITDSGYITTVTVEWLYATQPPPEVMTDVTLGWFVELGRRGTGKSVSPSRVELTRPDPGGGAHQAYFACPVRFGAPRNALVFRQTDLDRPFPGHNPELLALLDPALATSLADLISAQTTGEQVKAAVRQQLPSGTPEMSDVARDLDMSERTLQRRIAEEGTSFRRLLQEARRETARQLLRQPATAFDEVAFLLGYEDANSFYRAFHTWEGMTPGRWRSTHAES